MPALERDIHLTYHASYAVVQGTFEMLAAEKCSFATGKNEAKCSAKHPASTLLHKRQYTGSWRKLKKRVQGSTGRKYENLMF
jgi:hypothetical protein